MIPSAIVGGNDRLAIAAMSLPLDRGIPVPERVKITGFNGFEQRRYVRSSRHDGHIFGVRDGRARRTGTAQSVRQQEISLD